jgi:hypothetical protein
MVEKALAASNKMGYTAGSDVSTGTPKPNQSRKDFEWRLVSGIWADMRTAIQTKIRDYLVREVQALNPQIRGLGFNVRLGMEAGQPEEGGVVRVAEGMDANSPFWEHADARTNEDAEGKHTRHITVIVPLQTPREGGALEFIRTFSTDDKDNLLQSPAHCLYTYPRVGDILFFGNFSRCWKETNLHRVWPVSKGQKIIMQFWMSMEPSVGTSTIPDWLSAQAKIKPRDRSPARTEKIKKKLLDLLFQILQQPTLLRPRPARGELSGGKKKRRGSARCRRLRKTVAPRCRDDAQCMWWKQRGQRGVCADRPDTSGAPNDKACASFRKTKDPACAAQKGCRWRKRRGERGRCVASHWDDTAAATRAMRDVRGIRELVQKFMPKRSKAARDAFYRWTAAQKWYRHDESVPENLQDLADEILLSHMQNVQSRKQYVLLKAKAHQVGL